MSSQKYDIAAYVWPSYTGKEVRSRIFWPDGIGEWQTVYRQTPKEDGYFWNRKPLWGPVDEADPAVMEKEIDCAVAHGVNVFIYDWYWYDHRPFLEQCLDEGFLGAQNNSQMKFYLMWANHDANYTWDYRLSGLARDKSLDTTVWRGSCDRVDFDSVCDRIIERYFKQPNYYQIDGKPVFMIYDVDNLIRGLGGIDQTQDAIRAFRRKCVDAGFAGLELQLTGWGERVQNVSGVDADKQYHTKDIVEVLGFDSVTNYQFVHLTDVNRSYDEILADIRKEYGRMEKEYQVPYYPHVSIGWDNNPRFIGKTAKIMRDNTPDAFENGLRMAKEYVDTHDLPAPLITVNSWNEWTETSYLEPDDLYGYGYLDAIKKVFTE